MNEVTGHLEFDELDPEFFKQLMSITYEFKIEANGHEIFKCKVIEADAIDENTCMLVSEEGHYITVTNLFKEGWLAKLRRIIRKLLRW